MAPVGLVAEACGPVCACVVMAYIVMACGQWPTDLHSLYELELSSIQVAAASLHHGDLCVDMCVDMRADMCVDVQWTRATHCWKALAEAVILRTGASKPAQ